MRKGEEVILKKDSVGKAVFVNRDAKTNKAAVKQEHSDPPQRVTRSQARLTTANEEEEEEVVQGDESSGEGFGLDQSGETVEDYGFSQQMDVAFNLGVIGIQDSDSE